MGFQALADACNDHVEARTILIDANCFDGHDQVGPRCSTVDSDPTQTTACAVTHAQVNKNETLLIVDRTVLPSCGAEYKETSGSPRSAMTCNSEPSIQIGSMNCQVMTASSIGHHDSGLSIDGQHLSSLSIDPELEEICYLTEGDVPMIDFVTNDLVKVSIQQSVVRTTQHTFGACGNNVDISKQSELLNFQGCNSMLGPPRPLYETSQQTGSLQNNAGTTEMKSANLCLINDECLLELGREGTVDSGDDVYVHKDGEINETGAFTKVVEEDSKEVDSSSSTSTLSLSSSSDDEEAGCYSASNKVNRKSDVEPESECEEGELKASPSQKKNTHETKKVVNESSDEERGINELPPSKTNMKDLPRVPTVSVVLQPYHNMEPAGVVASIVGVNLIVEGIEGHRPLSEGSILWLTGQRSPLGIVDELFGPVKKPFYIVRYNEASEVPKEAKEGACVSYVHDYADFVLSNPDLYAKGYDNGCEDREAVSDSEVYFSDDEKEAEYKRTKFRGKRGSLETRTFQNDTLLHQESRIKGKQPGRDNSKLGLEESSGRRKKNQKSTVQHRVCSRDLPFQEAQSDRELPSYQCYREKRKPSYCRTGSKPMQKCNDWQFEDQCLTKQAWSQKQKGFSQPKVITRPQQRVSLSDVVSKRYQSPGSPQPFCHEAQPVQSNQFLQSTPRDPLLLPTARPIHSISSKSQMQLLQGFSEPNSQQLHANCILSPSQSISDLQELKSDHCFSPQVPLQLGSLQSQSHLPLPCSQTHVLNQSHVGSTTQNGIINQPVVYLQTGSQLLAGVQHTQKAVCNGGMITGQLSQPVGNCYSEMTLRNAPLRSSTDVEKGMLSRSTISQTHSSSQTHFSAPRGNQFSAPAFPSLSMLAANQVQQVSHVDGYPLGVQAPAFSTLPVLGIPVGQAAMLPSNYAASQPTTGLNSGCHSYCDHSPLMHGMPDHSRLMQPISSPPGFSGVPGQQQRISEDGFSQKPYQRRPQSFGRAPYKGQRF